MKECLDRREFARLSAAVAIAVLGHRSLAEARPERIVGIQQYMVKDLMTKDPEGTLAKLASIGYTEIEAYGFTIANPKEFRQQVNAAGLRCFSGQFDFGFDDPDKALDKASALGVRYAISSMLLPRLRSGVDFYAMVNSLSQDDFKRMAYRANEIGEHARKRGLKYAYHNHWFEFRDFGNGETGYSILLKETDSALVEFEPDAGWMAVGGANPVQLLQKMQGRFHLIHFKDFVVRTNPASSDHEQQFVDLGDGMVPLKSIVDCAKDLGIEHFIVDHDPPFHGMTAIDAARLDYGFLAGLLKG